MEVIVTSIISRLLFGGLVGHFTTLDIFPKLERAEDAEFSKVNVHFEAIEPENTLVITVTDDGRGLNETENHKSGHKSFGLKILKERLLLISDDSEFSIENRKNTPGCISKLVIPLFHRLS